MNHPVIDSLAHRAVGTKTPGLAVIVLQRGEIVHYAAYGVADIESNAPFTTTTPTYVASLAKMFTAHAILQQIDAGQLSFDTKLGDVLPEVPAYAKQLTIRQLLTHTSGLADHLGIGGDERTYTYSDVLKILADADSLLFEPQSRSSYSNSAYILLAKIVEKVTGVPYETYVSRNFFERFGMKNAAVVTSKAELPRNRAIGYARDSTGFRRNDYEPSSTQGAGGMYMSLADLHEWALALRSGAVVNAESSSAAATPAVRSNGRPTPWGMGWLAESHGPRDPLSGKTYVAAVGNLRGFSGLLKWYRDDDVVIIWLANANSPDVFDGMEGIARRILLGR